MPSDGDEQLASQTRTDDPPTGSVDDNEDDAQSSDGLTTANRGVPLQFDPDTYSYDAEVDAILHQHSQQEQHQPHSELQDIEERTGSAAYTTATSDEDDSVDDHSNAMRVAPPYLMVAPPRTYASEDADTANNNSNHLSLRNHTLSYVSELSSSQSSETQNSVGSAGSHNSSTGSVSTDDEEPSSPNNSVSSSARRMMLAGAVISPAVTALSLAHGSSTEDGDDHPSVLSLRRSSSSHSNNQKAYSRNEDVDEDSVSALAATATPLLIDDEMLRTAVEAKNNTDDDEGEKVSVHSFSVGTASSEDSPEGSQAHMLGLVSTASVDEEVGSSGNTLHDDLVSSGARTVAHSNMSKKPQQAPQPPQRTDRKWCTGCKGITWGDRAKLVVAILVWAGLAALVYFLVVWSMHHEDNKESSNNIGVNEGATGGSESVQTPPVAPPIVIPTASPTSTLDALFQLLVSASFDKGAALSVDGSPQNKAFNWLAYSNLNLTEYSDAKKLTRYALATFYWSTGGNQTWVDEALWLSDRDECDWFTRSRATPCNFEGGFQDLEVSYNNLEGVIPPELALLSDSLITINIGGGPNNAIGGSLPKELGYLSNLEELRLPSNKLTGTLSMGLSGWSSIRTIDLSGNRLQGLIPNEIGLMTDLYSFNAENNLLSGPIPTTIGKLVHLKTLTLSKNKLTSIPTEIGQLGDLVFLELQENEFAGALPSEIGMLNGLRQLKLNDNTFGNAMPTELSLLSGLASLDMSYNSFTGPLPPFGLASPNQMRDLRLSHNLLTGSVPPSFANLTGVQTLLLQENNLVGVMPPVVCTVFTATFPTVFVDCDELVCPCCNFCCTDEIGCACQFINSTAEWQCL